jgi:glycosyltransferase involved in cell wall biosynthesis
VNTKVYASAVDLFLDSFPFPCGFSLKEAMAAGKPVVMFRSPESMETGVPGAISSMIEGSASVSPEVRERLERVFTRHTPFDLYCCGDSPQGYVELAERLMREADFAAAAGAANRRYIEEFASSPPDEAKKLLDHLDELFAAIPRAQ